jgi:hypothetical protein
MSLPTPVAHWLTAIFGVLQRSCRPSPIMNLAFMKRFSNFCADFLPIALREVKLEIDYEFDAERWINGMDKPQKWKEPLLKLLRENHLMDYLSYALYPSSLDQKERLEAELFSIFQKDESYPKVTATRIIFALTNFYRVVHGDICKTVGDQLVHNANTFSGVPVTEWPRILGTRFNVPGLPAVATDFSGFEKWFSNFIKHVVDYVPFALVAAGHPDAAHRLEHMRQSEVCVSIFRHSCFRFKSMDSFQQSGSHKTYSVNTFGHWLLTAFLHFVHTGQHPRVVPRLGVQNGDDVDDGHAPCFLSGDDSKIAKAYAHAAQDFRDLGLDVELEPGATDDSLAFCKVRPLFSENGDWVGVAEFWDVLAKLPWIPAAFAYSKRSKVRAMLKAKCMSYLYQYPSAPVISTVCAKVVTELRHVDTRGVLKHFDAWERGKVEKALASYEGGGLSSGRPSAVEYSCYSEMFGVPMEVLRSLDDEIQSQPFGDDLSLSCLAKLKPFAEAVVPGYLFNTELYECALASVDSWVPPRQRVDRLDQLRTLFWYQANISKQLCRDSKASLDILRSVESDLADVAL